MPTPNMDDLRAIETVLSAISPLELADQVKVLTWVIDKLDLCLDMKLAIQNSKAKHRSYIELAYENTPEAMQSPGEFFAAAAPDSLADRVLVVCVYLQLRLDDPDNGVVTGKEINSVLRSLRQGVSNITDCVYTLIRRSPPHIMEAGRAPNRRDWKGYRATESGIEYVYERIARLGTDTKSRPLKRLK